VRYLPSLKCKFTSKSANLGICESPRMRISPYLTDSMGNIIAVRSLWHRTHRTATKPGGQARGPAIEGEAVQKHIDETSRGNISLAALLVDRVFCQFAECNIQGRCADC
ncbi:MAG TPA: hypothetical protein VNY05_07445, partial [Candidatus Acidoferrales bacterium]|nr:hypothetical protein [Candidatus Acidoferrales bacterium]